MVQHTSALFGMGSKLIYIDELYYFLMAESFCVPIASSDYQSLTIRIKELEEIVAELTRDNEEKAKIIAELTKQIEELKAKLAKYENPHTPSSAQRYKKKIRIQQLIKESWCSKGA
jgi:septal ring factor EnvC (AmiA/AmiB activator)